MVCCVYFSEDVLNKSNPRTNYGIYPDANSTHTWNFKKNPIIIFHSAGVNGFITDRSLAHVYLTSYYTKFIKNETTGKS